MTSFDSVGNYAKDKALNIGDVYRNTLKTLMNPLMIFIKIIKLE